MNQVPYIPRSAPFTPEQRAWLNGYLTGLFADANVGERNAPAQVAGLPAEKPSPLLVMYGSQTGTAEQLARRFAADAEKLGFAPRVLELNSFVSVDVAQENRLIIVTSTWGDGDPPDNAAGFWQHLNSGAAPDAGSPAELSKMTRLAMRLLGDSGQAPARRVGQATKDTVSKMTEHVSALLTKKPAKR